MHLFEEFLALNEVKRHSEYSELIRVKELLTTISELQPEKNNIREDLCKALLTILSKQIEFHEFKNIFVNSVSFDTVIYNTGLAITNICPINQTDFATLDFIDPANKVVTFDRHQFDVVSLAGLLKTTSLVRLNNPYTREPFSDKDKQHILACVKTYKPTLTASEAVAEFSSMLTTSYLVDDLMHALATAIENSSITPSSSEIRGTLSALHATVFENLGLYQNVVFQNPPLFSVRPEAFTLNAEDLASSASTTSTSGLFSQTTIPNLPMIHAVEVINRNSDLDCQITMEQLQQWRPHTRGAEFTFIHAQVLIYLMGDCSMQANDAIQSIMRKSEDEARQLLPGFNRPPRPGRIEDVD